MSNSGKGVGTVGYIVQSEIDAQNHVIIDHEVTHRSNDRGHAAVMVKPSRTVMNVEHLAIAADRSYW